MNNSVTEIDFYILDKGNTPPSQFACRLAETAFRKGHRIYIHAPSGEAARQLDELLWTFKAGSFLPHGIDHQGSDDPLPVVIGYESAPEQCDDVLINLNNTVPPFFNRFQRVVEIVAGDDNTRNAARQRYRYYKQQGLEPRSHTIDA